jgi:hypothetical protein
MFTTRSRGEPFVGKLDTATVESQVAEVIYFCARSGTEPLVDVPSDTRLYTLYRRVLLVAPGQQEHVATHTPVATYFSDHDISAHYDGTIVIANTLGDLTKRENRFAHYPTGATQFPFDVNQTPVGTTENAQVAPLTGDRLSDDVLLTNVLSFDVQVYDPGAPLRTSGSAVVAPPDPGYPTAGLTALGAYVDLGSTTYSNVEARFNDGSRKDITGGAITELAPALPVPAAGTKYTYDTWSLHYENDGLQEDTSHAADAATNGLDDLAPPVGGGAAVANGVVDDPTELDTQAPYAAPLRGIRVTIRVYEPSSRQVRQVTVVQDFLPE